MKNLKNIMKNWIISYDPFTDRFQIHDESVYKFERNNFLIRKDKDITVYLNKKSSLPVLFEIKNVYDKFGVDFDALDGEPVYIFVLLVAPKATAGPHLKALAQISRLLRDTYFCELIRKCKTEEEVFNLIKNEEEKKH